MLYRIGPHEELVGFITARVSLLHECNPTDRVLMNLNSAYLDGQRVLYILTLGVLESARQQGIGSALLRLILEEVCLYHTCQTQDVRHMKHGATIVSLQTLQLEHTGHWNLLGRGRGKTEDA